MNKLNFNNEYILEDDMVLLRPIKESDFDSLLEYSINEPEIWEFSTLGTGADGKKNLKKYIDNAIKNKILL